MARYELHSPGAAAFTAIYRIMQDQAAQRRQSVLDGIAIDDRQRAIARAEAEARRQAQQDANEQADRLARIVGPTADLTPEQAAGLRAGGYTVNDMQTLPARAGMPAGMGMPGMRSEDDLISQAFKQPSADNSPLAKFLMDQETQARQPIRATQDLGSSSYSRRAPTYAETEAQRLRDEAQREKDKIREDTQTFTAQQNEANRAAAKERADADRDMRELIARMSASNSVETRALGNELRRLQIAAAQDKLDTQRETREKAAGDARATTERALTLANRLLDTNDVGAGLGAAQGAYEMRGWTQGAQDFNAVRDQLVAALTQPNLGALKGPMSDKDVAFIKALATRLDNRRMSEGETIKALTEAQTFLRSKVAGGGASRLTAHNPTTGEVIYSDDGGSTWHK